MQDYNVGALATLPEDVRAKVGAQLGLIVEAVFGVLYGRLERVDQAPDGTCWHARCPCHADLGQALTVTISTYGVEFVELHCAAGCEPERLYAAVGLPPPVRWVM